MSADFTPEKEDYKILTPFKMQVLTNFPYIEADFDALTNYQLLCKVVEYLNNVIANENEVTEQVTSLYNAYVALQNYVNTYFDTLDLQEEVNTKLNEMAADGTLTNIIKDYVDPIYQAYETEINQAIENQNIEITNFKSNINDEIAQIDEKVDSSTSGSPAGVYTTVAALTTADPDHSKIYLVENDGKWYYYNSSTTSWTAGGTYQATVLSQDNPVITDLRSELREDNEGIIHYKNLVSEVHDGQFVLATGGAGNPIVINNNDSYYYMQIPVHYGLYYSCSKEPGSNSFCCVTDADNNIIGQLGSYKVGTSGYIYQMPINAKWMYISRQIQTNHDDYVVLNTNQNIVGYSTAEYPFNELVRISIPLLQNENKTFYVGVGQQFTDIQSAIDYVNTNFNTQITPITIIIKNGVYNVTPSASSPYYAINKGSNKISLIGESRDQTIINCTCTSTRQGIALNVGGDCTIANLTINNLADPSYTEETILEGNHRPYCIHNDEGFNANYTYTTAIVNCKLYSECDTPVGAGLHNNQIQRYERVEAIYNSNIDKQHGSIYVHASIDPNDVSKGLDFIDCTVISLNQMPTLCLWDVSSAGTHIADTPMTFIRNVTATNGSQELSISGYNKTIYSKLNSANNLNY